MVYLSCRKTVHPNCCQNLFLTSAHTLLKLMYLPPHTLFIPLITWSKCLPCNKQFSKTAALLNRVCSCYYIIHRTPCVLMKAPGKNYKCRLFLWPTSGAPLVQTWIDSPSTPLQTVAQTQMFLLPADWPFMLVLRNSSTTPNPTWFFRCRSSAIQRQSLIQQLLTQVAFIFLPCVFPYYEYKWKTHLGAVQLKPVKVCFSSTSFCDLWIGMLMDIGNIVFIC